MEYLIGIIVFFLSFVAIVCFAQWLMGEDRYRWNVFYERIDGSVYEVCYGNTTYTEMLVNINDEQAWNHSTALYMEKYYRSAEDGTGLIAVEQLKYW